MPYTISRHNEDLIWVEMEGYLTLHQAESYFVELWSMLDASTQPLDLLVDGRRIEGGAHGARRRTEQVVHHSNLGHMAFVVGEYHLLVFAPFVKLVSGIGLFGNEHEALSYLYAARGRPAPDRAFMHIPPPPDSRELPPLPAARPTLVLHKHAPSFSSVAPPPPSNPELAPTLLAREVAAAPLHNDAPPPLDAAATLTALLNEVPAPEPPAALPVSAAPTPPVAQSVQPRKPIVHPHPDPILAIRALRPNRYHSPLGCPHIIARPLPPRPASRQKQTPIYDDGQGSGDGMS